MKKKNRRGGSPGLDPLKEESWGRKSSIILVSVTNSKYLVVVIGGEGLKSSQGKCRSCITIRHKYLNKNKATSHSSDVKTL